MKSFFNAPFSSWNYKGPLAEAWKKAIHDPAYWIIWGLVILLLTFLMYGCSTQMEVLYGPPVYYVEGPAVQIQEVIPDSLARVMLFIQDTTVTSWMYYYIPNSDGSPSDSVSNEWMIQTPALWNRQDRFYDYQLRPYESKYIVLQFYQY